MLCRRRIETILLLENKKCTVIFYFAARIYNYLTLAQWVVIKTSRQIDAIV
jgi:hypothetical protein